MRTKPLLHEITQRNVELIAQMEKESVRQRTLGERVADLVASGVGSWTFLIAQSIILVLWMMANVLGWWLKWDPYPFVLLNLVLSFQAAYATPIILMSQNRQGRLSDRRNHLDLQINLLAEQENTEQLRLLRLLCDREGIRHHEPSCKALEESTQPEQIIQQITQTVENHDEPH